MAGYASDVFPSQTIDNGIWVEICGSSKLIHLDLGDDEKPPLQPIHSKVCHAVCCQNEDDLDNDSQDNKNA